MTKTDARGRGCWQRTLHYGFNLIVAVYALGVTVPLVLGGVAGDGWWPIGLFHTFAHILWLPVLLLLPLCLLLRRWWLAALLTPAFLAFLLVVGTAFIPPPALEYASPNIRVMTYNIQWREDDYAETIAIIRSADADIVAIQELSEDAARILEAQLVDEYPHMALHPQAWGIDGQGVLSRYPIVSSEYWQSEGSFGNQRAVVRFQDREVAVYNVHPVHPGVGPGFFDTTLRGRGIEEIMQVVEADDRIYKILLGDFNMPPLSTDYSRVTQRFDDAFRRRGTGLGHTYTYGYGRLRGLLPPILRLDYIFVNWSIQPTNAYVIPNTGGSDHRPVVADLWINLDPTAS